MPVKTRRKAPDYEAALAPFRLEPPPDDLAPEIVEAGYLGFTIVAVMLGLHRTCPRRECRRACAAGGRRGCGAEFPAMALDMVLGMQYFLLSIPQDLAFALHAIRRDANRRASGEADDHEAHEAHEGREAPGAAAARAGDAGACPW